MSEYIFKQNELNSIIRVIKGLIKRVAWCSFEEKRKIFICVIQRSDIPENVKMQMFLNVESTKDEKDFFRYLQNSQNFYEQKIRALRRQKLNFEKLKNRRLLSNK